MKKIICLYFLFTLPELFAQSDTTAINRQLTDSLITLNNLAYSAYGADLDSDVDQQDVSSLLQSSRDVFIQYANFQFGLAGYKVRGYNNQQTILLNGIKLENPENGSSSIGSLGGLNDVTRNIEFGLGISANRSAFSSSGGYLNIDSKATTFKKNTRFSYSYSNRTFRHRSMITQSTGSMKNGWALVISASTRQGNQVYRPGTYYNASAIYIAVEKQFGDRQSIGLITFITPQEKAGFASEPLEVYSLTNTNYYNSLWGYQNGKMRNSTVNKSLKPTTLLTHTFKLNTSSRLTTSAFYSFGTSGLTGLNWSNAPDPRPDYYSHLPSYFSNKGNQVGANLLTEKWKSDLSTSQIDWDKMISTNQDNLYTLPASDPKTINTTETRARYILEERIEKLNHYGFTTVFNKRINNLFLSCGVNAVSYSSRKYKLANDLLGATFWLDYDMFAQGLGVDPSFKQNNIDEPDKKIYQDNRFGYDYAIHINSGESWGQLEYTLKKLEIYGAITGSYQQIWRTGYMANGKFPQDSKGSSNKFSFINYGVKSGATYKISGRHFITVNALLQTKAPEVNSIFISQSTRNEFVHDLKPAKTLASDLNYYIKLPTLKLRLTVYYTRLSDQMWHRIYYSDLYNTNVNLVMKNIQQNNGGFEFGVEKTIYTTHVLSAAVGIGEFIYSNRPTLEAWQDNNSKAIFTNRVVYLKNYRVGSSPQTVIGCGYKYNSKKWFAGIYFNYFDQNFTEVNPDRRTEEALSSFFETESQVYQKVTRQEKLPSYYTMNANAGKSFRINKKYTFNLNLSVNNLLNTKNNLLLGREQLRWDAANIDKFPNKYTYMTGITYMAMINLSF